MSDISKINKEIANLRAQGVSLPRHPQRAMQTAAESYDVYRNLQRNASADINRASIKLNKPITAANYDSPEVQKIIAENQALSRAMGSKRALSSRMQRVSGVGGDVMNAIPRFYDPLEYWDLSGLPWNVQDEGHRHKLHKWLRLYYATHYLVPILIDIFTRFPLVGMRVKTKDPKLQEFYEDLFIDKIDYGEFLVDIGREHWLVGEAFPLGSFDEDIGVWEREELINPEDIVIENFPFLGSQQFKVVPPSYIKRLVQEKSPAKEYRQLEVGFPDIIPYLKRGEHIPVSDVLIKQVANKLTHWDDHGTPILLRGLRTLLHEEKIIASQDAIAERLYSPLILAKLGIQNMGDGMPPFIPGPEELDSVRDDFDMALSTDFRLMVHHFGLEVSSVFGREQMPRIGDDFDRIEKRLMQLFGVNPSLLSAGSGGQPYASSALQAEFINQILKTYQNTLIRHFQSRAAVVAEAQGHYDYEVKGRTRVPVYETVVEYDMDGNKRVKEVPKLLIPTLEFSTLDLRDEATERQFLQNLRQIGVPIPDEDLMVGVRWDLKEKVQIYNDELKNKTIQQQRAKMDTYTALVTEGIPVPLDLRQEVESVLQGAPQGQTPAGGAVPGVNAPGQTPPAGGIVMPPPPAGIGGDNSAIPPGGGAPAIAPTPAGPRGTVPEVSNERRPGLTYNTHRNRHATKIDDDSPLGLFITKHYVGTSDTQYDSLGVPFNDFLVDNNKEGKSYDTLYELSKEEVERLYKEWPEHKASYEQRVVAEVLDTSGLKDDGPFDIIEDPSEELHLKRNQELQQDAEGNLRIIEKSSKKRIVTQTEPSGKKYSIVDTEAEPLSEE